MTGQAETDGKTPWVVLARVREIVQMTARDRTMRQTTAASAACAAGTPSPSPVRVTVWERTVSRFCIATLIGLAACLAGSSSKADVRLPHVIGDHMVLQREVPLKIWGWANPGEKVTVKLADAKATGVANDTGEWKVTLPAQQAGGPHIMTVKGQNTLTIKDILVGEVWLGSGQSNMQWSVQASANAGEEIAAANYPKIRFFLVPNVLSGIPQRDVSATWKPCRPESVRPFSAVLYYFGRHLHRELDVPVGLIASSWGGSRIEPWTPPVGFARVKRLEKITEQIRNAQLEYLTNYEAELEKSPQAPQGLRSWIRQAKQAAKKDRVLPAALPVINDPEHPLAGWPVPTSMYNAMIHPVVPFSIRGAIWYQGESNLEDGMLYQHKMRALIEGWREVWGRDFSFYWAQLAPFNYGGDPYRLPRIWEAQQTAMSIPQTGMAVITDIGNLRDIHPRNKQDVGKRLALWALAKDYGREIVFSGPTYRSLKVEGNRIRLYWDHVGSGLESRNGKALSHFEIRGDGEFVPAQATIDGDTVVVSSDEVAQPTAVRFGWNQLAEPNLQNKEGLPACPFRTTSTAPTISGRRLFTDSVSVRLDCLESDGVIRYTLDGTAPDASSAVYQKPLSLSETVTLRAKFFRSSGAESAISRATFTRVSPRKYQDLTLTPGVRYQYYHGQWNSLPDFDSLKPIKEGILDDFSLSERTRDDQFGFRFTGYLEIKEAGEYTFHLGSDDGSKLVVDGKELINNDGIHPTVTKTAAVQLNEGFHKIVVTYFELGGQEELSVKFQEPGSPLGPMPLWSSQ